MSVKDYREKREKFNEFKERLFDRERGHCQKCGRSNGLMVYFEDEKAKQTLDESKAVLLCGTCFETVVSVNRILQAQKEYAEKKGK